MELFTHYGLELLIEDLKRTSKERSEIRKKLRWFVRNNWQTTNKLNLGQKHQYSDKLLISTAEMIINQHKMEMNTNKHVGE